MEAFNYIIQFNIIFTLLVLLYHLLLKHNTDFQFNRVFLLAVAIFSLLTPLISIPVLSETELLSFPLLSDDSSARSMNDNSTAMAAITIQEFIAYCYGIITAALLLLLSIKLYKLIHHLKGLKAKASFDHQNEVYVLDSPTAPFTFLRWVFLPAEIITDKGVELIITHEKSHAKGLHTVDNIIAEIMSCLLFINPLYKIYKKHIIENHEYLADAAALQKDKESTYTDILIKQTLYTNQIQLVSFFAKPTILNRLMMMKRTNKNLGKKSIAVLSGLLIVSVMACELQSEEQVTITDNKDSEAKAMDISNSDKIFTKTEQQAEPLTGIDDFYNFISKELEHSYPKQAQSLGIEGIVYIQFTIEKDGSLSNITAVKGIGGGCDKAAEQALAAYGKWTPAKQSGVIVRSQRVVPIRFVLE